MMVYLNDYICNSNYRNYRINYNHDINSFVPCKVCSLILWCKSFLASNYVKIYNLFLCIHHLINSHDINFFSKECILHHSCISFKVQIHESTDSHYYYSCLLDYIHDNSFYYFYYENIISFTKKKKKLAFFFHNIFHFLNYFLLNFARNYYHFHHIHQIVPIHLIKNFINNHLKYHLSFILGR